MENNKIKNILYDIPDTDLVVTDTGKLFKSDTNEEVMSEFIRLKDKVVRTKSLILTVYKVLDRQDLYPTITNVWYEFYKDYNHYIDYSLVDFCKEQGINYEKARNALKRGTTTKDGWSIRRCVKTEKSSG